MSPKPWSGRRVLITSGPTREPLDGVRYLTNSSTGLMGFSLARAARDLGARVLVVSGPTSLEAPRGVALKRVTTALEMRRVTLAAARGVDVVIGAAAVGDWRVARPARGKLKRGPRPVTLRLLPNPDIIAEVAGSRRRPRLVVGFALESRDWLANARRKLLRKGLDAVVANRTSTMGASSGRFAVLLRDGTRMMLPPLAKAAAARVIVRRMASIGSLS